MITFMVVVIALCAAALVLQGIHLYGGYGRCEECGARTGPLSRRCYRHKTSTGGSRG